MNNWIDINDRLPDPGEYVLVSFENFTLPDIGRYETDSDGSGAFYPGDGRPLRRGQLPPAGHPPGGRRAPVLRRKIFVQIVFFDLFIQEVINYGRASLAPLD